MWLLVLIDPSVWLQAFIDFSSPPNPCNPQPLTTPSPPLQCGCWSLLTLLCGYKPLLTFPPLQPMQPPTFNNPPSPPPPDAAAGPY